MYSVLHIVFFCVLLKLALTIFGSSTSFNLQLGVIGAATQVWAGQVKNQEVTRRGVSSTRMSAPQDGHRRTGAGSQRRGNTLTGERKWRERSGVGAVRTGCTEHPQPLSLKQEALPPSHCFLYLTASANP